jgi:hypothetical protein
VVAAAHASTSDRAGLSSQCGTHTPYWRAVYELRNSRPAAKVEVAVAENANATLQSALHTHCFMTMAPRRSAGRVHTLAPCHLHRNTREDCCVARYTNVQLLHIVTACARRQTRSMNSFLVNDGAEAQPAPLRWRRSVVVMSGVASPFRTYPQVCIAQLHVEHTW